MKVLKYIYYVIYSYGPEVEENFGFTTKNLPSLRMRKIIGRISGRSEIKSLTDLLLNLKLVCAS